jgi:hypothetical protein
MTDVEDAWAELDAGNATLGCADAHLTPTTRRRAAGRVDRILAR